jgi:sulfatase modifying factor 1
VIRFDWTKPRRAPNLGRMNRTRISLAALAGALASLISCGSDEEKSSAAAVAANPAIEGMVWLPSGKFMMGSDLNGMPYEGPAHFVELDGFYIDETEVTNAQFRKFVEETGYVTEAEKPMPEDQLQYVPPEVRAKAGVTPVPFGSMLFKKTDGPVPLNLPNAPWWDIDPFANWLHPDGFESSIEGKDDYPVVCVTRADALAYADWAGKRLPTEAEWEYAARGGLNSKKYEWGNTPLPAERNSKPEDWPCNIWQGNFPYDDWGTDGFAGLSPSKSYKPNGYGLFDMTGNVWEICNDGFKADYFALREKKNPQGPVDPETDQTGNVRYVMRGASWRIHRSYGPASQQGGAPVLEYRVTMRNHATNTDCSTNDVGFRCVKDR